jgi:hypothetical protein
MRFQGFLTEKKIPPATAVQIIRSSCKPFLREIENGWFGFLYRGSKKRFETNIERFSSRTDRRPVDMSLTKHEILDRIFEKKFGWKARSGGVFCSGHPSIAARYGTPYLFFPIGEYKYIWSPEIRDLYDYINKKTPSFMDTDKDIVIRETEKFFENVVDLYKDNDLKEAMKAGNEITMKCKTYYLSDMTPHYMLDALLDAEKKK